MFTSFGFNFDLTLFEIFLASEKRGWGIFSTEVISCLGIKIMWPFEIGFISKTAIEYLSSSILYEGICPSTMFLKTLCCFPIVGCPYFIRLFFSKNFSSCSSFISSTCCLADVFLSSEKVESIWFIN